MVTIAPVLITIGRARPPLAHTCTAPDRRFIEDARTNLTALVLWGEQYESGDARAADVAAEARSAAKILHGTVPTDPSLAQTRRLLLGMLSEYARAVTLQERHREAGPHMYRAYGLANYAHDVLAAAQPALAARGCDLAELL